MLPAATRGSDLAAASRCCGQARPLAFALAVAYLLAPQLQSAVLTEFHAVPLAVPLILWALWAVEVRRWGQFAWPRCCS